MIGEYLDPLPCAGSVARAQTAAHVDVGTGERLEGELLRGGYDMIDVGGCLEPLRGLSQAARIVQMGYPLAKKETVRRAIGGSSLPRSFRAPPSSSIPQAKTLLYFRERIRA